MPVVIMERAVCINATCCSSERTPRTFVAITDPIATMETATSASAINTSMIVKPASLRSVGCGAAGDNFDPSGQPVDANLVCRLLLEKKNKSVDGHHASSKNDGRQNRTPVA